MSTTQNPALDPQYCWDLSPLFTGLDDPKYLGTKEEAKAFLNAFSTRFDTLHGADLLQEALPALEKAKQLLSPLLYYLELARSADMRQNAYTGELAQLQNLAIEMQQVQQQACHALADLDLDELLQQKPDLAVYAYTLHRWQEKAHYSFSLAEERLYSVMDQHAGQAWGDLFSHLTANLTVDWPDAESKTLTLSEVRNLASSPDADLRKKAYEAELAAYPKIQDSLAFALNHIKSQVSWASRERGFASPLDQALWLAAMQRETLEAMLSAIEAKLPIFRHYLQLRAKVLGYGAKLPFFALFAPLFTDAQRFEVEEAKAYLLDAFSSLDAGMASMFQQAFEERWIDFFPRQGKVGGAFCAEVNSLQQSRILSNFDGSFSSVSTLAHELGHAWHNQCSFDHLLLNQGYGMPVAETASTFNETHLASYALSHSQSARQQLSILDEDLSNLTQTCVDILSRFYFEDAVFAQCEERFLSAEDLCQLMLEAQDKSYGDALDAEYRHPYMWACKGHYYSSGLSYYNFPYAFGALLAQGLYALYLSEGSAWLPNYHRFLNLTNVASVEDAARAVGIDMTQPRFWEQSLDLVAKRIEQFEELLKKEQLI